MSDPLPEANPFTARWTAKGNNLCLGHWEISYAGNPLQLDPNDMGTYAIYSFFDPDDTRFAEGLHEDAWIAHHAQRLANLFKQHNIPYGEEKLRAFYQAVNPHDWRCGSCGGCI